MKSVITTVALAATLSSAAYAADLIDMDEASTSATYCMACATDPQTGHHYQTFEYPMQVVREQQTYLDLNQQAINSEVVAATEALNVLAEEGFAAYNETHDRITAEVNAGNARLDALERLSALTTNQLGQASAIESNTQRISALEGDLDELRSEAAGWSSMAAAMDSGYLRRDEVLALSVNGASIGGSGAGALNAVVRATDRLTFNASGATDGTSAGVMVGARLGF